MKTILNKIWFSFSIFIGVFSVLFFLFQILSLDSVLSMIGQNSNKETEKAIAKQFHLDIPVWQRFSIQLNDCLPISIHSSSESSLIYYDRLNYSGYRLLSFSRYSLFLKLPYFGRSFQSQELVSFLLWERFQTTIVLTIVSIIFASILGIGLGIVSAIHQNKWQDNFILTISSIGVSAPSFFVGIILALVFGYYLSDYTGLHFKGSITEYDDYGNKFFNLKNLILPILALSWRPLAIITLLTRNSFLDVLKEDYIRTAIANGLSRFQIYSRHALQNALNPVITSISGWFA